MFYDPPVSAVKWTSLQFLAAPLHPPAPGGGSGGVGKGGMQDLLDALNRRVNMALEKEMRRGPFTPRGTAT